MDTLMTEAAIAVLPYGGKLGRRLSGRDLDDLIWPLGRPARLSSGRVADLTPDDHLIIYPKTNMHFLPDLGTRAKITAMVVEPSVIHARHLRWLRLTYRRFFRVMTYHQTLLDHIPNGLFLPYGTTWVPDYDEVTLEKTRHMSLIASGKRDHEGHQLRHRLVQHVQQAQLDVDILGRGYAPFDRKSEGLARYRFSVVIENVREPNYFSEKLVDAILCETVPIYWGCPNIADFINTKGMVICDTQDDVQRAIAAASLAQYDALVPALLDAKPQAVSFIDLELRAAETLKASL
ncbi:MAG: glycosyltransferase family 10 domain-containing protein [Sulfitobacter sp.]|uniref:glycosyltransferase family 10 domain-containing protein n=1 Tax=Sulfitobacter sp. TaxID=1903071 RepID=UPI004057FFB1